MRHLGGRRAVGQEEEEEEDIGGGGDHHRSEGRGRGQALPPPPSRAPPPHRHRRAGVYRQESRIRPDHAPESPQRIGSMISPSPPRPHAFGLWWSLPRMSWFLALVRVLVWRASKDSREGRYGKGWMGCQPCLRRCPCPARSVLSPPHTVRLLSRFSLDPPPRSFLPSPSPPRAPSSQ